MTESRVVTRRAPLKARTPSRERKQPKTLALNRDVFVAIAAREGWRSYAEIADELGISESQVERVVACKQTPSPAFIAGLLSAVLGLDFEHVFAPVIASGTVREEGK